MNRETIEKSNTIHGNIIKFLKNSNEPKSMKEIVEHILKDRTLNTDTPNNTIRGVIQRSKFIKKNVYAKFELIEQ
jgi:hypothetical protein